MVAARVLVVTLAYVVIEIAVAVVGVHITDKALTSALRTDGFLLTMPRDAGTVKHVAIV